jgi:antitoxin component YwqK of YwqJK toxin-antitoxin module
MNGNYVLFNEIGIKLKEYFMFNGNQEGESKVYYESGNIMMITNYINNKLEGRFITYNSLGILSELYNFTNGQLNGDTKHYYPTGQLHIFRHYKNGKNDICVTYYENGQIKK